MRELVNNKYSIREKLLCSSPSIHTVEYEKCMYKLRGNFQYTLNLNVRRDELTYLEAFAEDILRKPGS